ncbi:hypothetical protein DGWBC_0166 [Dehalogenimonas sp. WBC-2]|nr:hypothetical protein DGWBC_0166 [Dehalogenimonas sp. WBC-2]
MRVMNNNHLRRTAPVILTLALLLVPAPQPLAAADARWSEVPLPQTGAASGWRLTPDTDIAKLGRDTQGRLYVWVTGASGGLFRADSAGENIIRLYASADSATDLCVTETGQIYYATDSTVYRSADGGLSFQTLATNPGGPGKRITGLSITNNNDTNLIAVSVTDDVDESWGGVFLLNEQDIFSKWIDTGIGNYDVLDVSISPTFIIDRTLLALASNGTDTFVMISNGSTWRATPLRHAGGSASVAVNGVITLPPDFSTADNPQFYAALNSGCDNGGLWLVSAQSPPQLPIAVELSSAGTADYACFSVSGSIGAYGLLAGAASGDIISSANGGATWQHAFRKPGGQQLTAILGTGDSLYAASGGSHSGLLKSVDSGLNWTPLAFVDDNTGTLVDILASPEYETDHTLYLLGFNNSHGLWRTEDDGLSWRKILGTGDFDIITIDLVKTATDGTLFIAATDLQGGLCLISSNRGTTFKTIRLPVELSSTAGFAAADKDRFYFTTFDGNMSEVWRTASGGMFFESVYVGSVTLPALALSPQFNLYHIMTAAASNGQVYISTDTGATFTALPTSPLSGSLRLAFSPDFGTSGKVYLSSNTANAGIYVLKIGGTSWKRVDSGLPAGTLLSGLAVASSGAIYAPSANSVSTATGGLARTLDESAAWNLTHTGLPDGATLWGISINNQKLWSLDTTNNRVMSYTDTIAGTLTLLSPAPQAPGLGIFTAGVVNGIDIKWQSISGATGYEWQLNDISDMSVPLLHGSTAASSVRLNSLEPGTTYYWQVRAVTPMPGAWSAKYTFTTALGGTVTVPQLISPEPGGINLITMPLFQWQPVSGATGYELLLSADPSFQSIIAAPSGISGNAWQPPSALAPATTHYWKIRAVSDNSFSAWSAISAFSTAATIATVPVTTSPVITAPTATPAPLTMAMPDWLAVTLAGMGGAVVMLLTALVIVARGRRP